MQRATLNDISDALTYIDPNLARDDWVRVLMGIKHEFGDAGRELADMWSQRGQTYNAANFKSTWEHSISSNGGVTIGTVIGMAKQNGYVFNQKPLTKAEQQAAMQEHEARAKERADKEKQASVERDQWHLVISNLTDQIIKNYTIKIKSNGYLLQKKIKAFNAFGLKKSLIVLFYHNQFKTDIITGSANINNFFNQLNLTKNQARDYSFLHFKRGDLVVPLIDVNKKIWNLQFINSNGTKLYLKFGRKSGCFAFIGNAYKSNVVALVEGYATGVTIHTAMQWPVAVTMDSGNLLTVAIQLKQLLTNHQFIICADNDINRKKNPGLTKAKEAANQVNGVVAVPVFNNEVS